MSKAKKVEGQKKSLGVIATENMVGELSMTSLVASTRPAPRHALASGNLSRVNHLFGDGGGGGWLILFEPELHFA